MTTTAEKVQYWRGKGHIDKQTAYLAGCHVGTVENARKALSLPPASVAKAPALPKPGRAHLTKADIATIRQHVGKDARIVGDILGISRWSVMGVLAVAAAEVRS